ncbi:MAG: Ig-like domain-containing protein, partial [Prosthecobacter sp.]
YNYDSQLGDGTTTTRFAPIQIGTATNWRSISAGDSTSHATRTDGTLWTWGSNLTGQLGTGNFTIRSSPGQVGTATCWGDLPPLQTASHTLAMTTDGTLWGFGLANSGQLARAWRNQLVPDVVWPAISAAQTISFPPVSNIPVGSSAPLNATASSGLPVRYIATGPGLISGSNLRVTGPGLITVIAYQPGDNFWQNSDIASQLINLPPPTSTTLVATAILNDSVTLTGSANPNGTSTTARFEWGPTTAYGSFTSAQPVGGGTSAVDVTAQLTGLTSRTTYHYRLVAQNSHGTDNGADMSFTTISAIPVAANKTVSTAEDVSKSITFTATDADGDPLTFAVSTPPAHGVITGTGNTVTYVPALNFNGGDTFTYVANDGYIDSLPATVTITVTPVNDDPVGTVGSASGNEDSLLSGTLNGTDVEGEPLVFSRVTNAAHGNVNVASNGSFTYQPVANYNGADSFSFTVNDGHTNSVAATFSLTVFPLNDAPVASNTTTTGSEDQPGINGSLTGSDVDNDPFTFTKLSDPAHGSITLNAGGSFSYVPQQDFNGTDSFTFRVSDGLLNSSTATASIIVTPINDAPVVTSGTASGNEDMVITGLAAGTDVDQNPLTFTKLTDPASGTIVMQPNGSFSYTPNANFNGTDSFTFKASDGQLNSNAGTIDLTINPVNDAPLAVASTAQGDEDSTGINGQLSASDPEMDAVTFIKASNPSHGTVTVQSDGAFTYIPEPDYYGPDSFSFKARDSTLDSNLANVSLTIRPVNDGPPVVADQSAVGTERNLLRSTLTATDVDHDPLTFTKVTNTTHGTVTVSADGTFSYRPEAEFLGADSFTVKASDGTADSNLATVTLVITTALPEWTWMNGAKTANQKGVTTPGARLDGTSWTDSAGDFWLFGGTGYGETTGPGLLNDLWKYEPATAAWTWLKGSKAINAITAYGTQGIADSGNTPGARNSAASWLDTQGNLWLFGGASGSNLLNDLWKYDPTSNAWCWMKGANVANSNGTFGSLGTPATANAPSCRSGAATWTDAAGCLWLFGGRGRGAGGTAIGNLSDLWRYDPLTNQWTWMKGANVIDSTANYGPQGTPGARSAATAWTDTQGNFWLFGGTGLAATTTSGNLSDLWKYDPGMNQWTWVSGASTTNAAGIYGTLGGVAATNRPGARNGATAWTDATGALWLFGGTGTGLLSDVWRYLPATNTWTWMKGPSTVSSAASHGTLGLADAANTPSARRLAMPFTDARGDLWLFGGANGSNNFSDLWKLDLPPAPMVRTLSADVAVDVTLRAIIHPNDLASTAHFRYSTNRDLSAAIDTPIEPASGSFSAVLTGLQPSTTYYFQAVAKNAFGQGVGALQSFTTPGLPTVPEASFVSASSTTDESAGTVSIKVQLNAANYAAFQSPSAARPRREAQRTTPRLFHP